MAKRGNTEIDTTMARRYATEGASSRSECKAFDVQFIGVEIFAANDEPHGTNCGP